MKNVTLMTSMGLLTLATPMWSKTKVVEKPNVILIYADDMGMGMLSCMGQKEFITPNIDRLFRQGTQFTHAYGCMVSAAARASLLTGYYDVRKEKIKVSGGGALLLDPATVTENDISRIENNIDKNDVILGTVAK